MHHLPFVGIELDLSFLLPGHLLSGIISASSSVPLIFAIMKEATESVIYVNIAPFFQGSCKYV